MANRHSQWIEALERLAEEDQAQFSFANTTKRNPQDILRDVLVAVKAKQDECLEKRWKIVYRGKTVFIRNILEKLALWLNKFVVGLSPKRTIPLVRSCGMLTIRKKIGNIVAQYDPVHISLPWAALVLILQAGVNNVEVFGFVLSSIEIIANILARSQVIDVLYLNPNRSYSIGDQLRESLILLYTKILEYLSGLLRFYNTKTVINVLRSVTFSKVDVEAKVCLVENAEKDVLMLSQLAEAEKSNEVLSTVSLVHHQQSVMVENNTAKFRELKGLLEQLQPTVSQIGTQVADMHTRLEVDTRARILKAISNIPYASHHKLASENRLKGSGKWLLEKPAFKKWLNDDSSSVLWLHGIPGSGKTKLTSLVVDQMRGKMANAHFYCMRNPAEPERAESRSILASFVRQLSTESRDGPLLESIIDRFQDGISQGFLDIEEQTWTKEEYIEALMTLVEDHQEVTLIIDALDEVDDNDRQDFIDTLGHVLRETNGLLKIFISSRDSYDIVLALEGSPNVYIEADDNAGDIKDFIIDRLKRNKLLRGKLPHALHDDIVTTLLAGARGMFRWVDLQIQTLRHLRVAADIRERLGSLPNTLEELYWEMYQQVMDSGEHAAELAVFTFQWLLTARESVSVEEFAVIASALLSPASDEGYAYTGADVRDVCANFVVARGESFQFAHLSVREFLENLTRRGIDNMIPEKSHARVARACLLHLRIFTQVYSQPIPSTSNKNVDGISSTGAQNITGISDYENEEYEEVDFESIYVRDVEYWSRKSWRRKADKKELLVTGEVKHGKLSKKSRCLNSAMRQDNELGNGANRYVVNQWLHHVALCAEQRRTHALDNEIKEFLVDSNTSDVSASFQHWARIVQWISWYSPAALTFTLARHPSPLWVAYFYGWFDILEYLFEKGVARIDEKCAYEWHPPRRQQLGKWTLDYEDTDFEEWNLPEDGSFYLDVPVEVGECSPLRLSWMTQNMTAAKILLQCERRLGGDPDPEWECLLYHNLLWIQGGDSKFFSAMVTSNYFGYEAPSPREEREILFRAVGCGNIEVVRLLVKWSIGLEGLSDALTLAISHGYDQITSELLTAGAEKEETAVLKEIKSGAATAALRLIDAGFNVSGRFLEKDRTALHYAAEQGFPKVIQAILGRKVVIDELDREKNTPLHLATRKGHKECVQILLNHGADVLAEDMGGKLPLDIAEDLEDVSIENMIREHMEKLFAELQAQILEASKN